MYKRILVSALTFSAIGTLALGTVTAQDMTTEVVEGNNDFALNLYHELSTTEGNIFVSPYSISQALAMTYAGATGQTAEEMAETLQFNVGHPALHEAFNLINTDLVTRGNAEAVPENGRAGRQLNIANALWGEQTYPFNPEFLNLLDEYYAGGFYPTDFMNDPDGARDTVNQWVAEQTEDLIQDIVPQGVFNASTRLALANAIYFNNAWVFDFNENATSDEDFFLLDGSAISVPTMHQQEHFGYSEGEGYQAISLPYQGSNMSMWIVLPEDGTFTDFETSFDREALDSIVAHAVRNEVRLSLPRFELEYDVELANVLSDMGMIAAFDRDLADFSGMADINSPDYSEAQRLFISAVLHKAFITVDEVGTEAAAATVVVMELAGAAPGEIVEPIVMDVNSPFLFVIRDDATGSLLFMGRVVNPVS